ncbi:MAG: hypothetical protein NTY53_27340, partial [Kiritimatiellaeota bacterium]|nr:hypothetical protein [Kiritimatiellota bacterium]
SGRISEKRPEVASTQRGARVPKGVRAISRSQHEAPEVDGVVLLRGPTAARCQPGDFVTAKIVHALDYDVIAEVE